MSFDLKIMFLIRNIECRNELEVFHCNYRLEKLLEREEIIKILNYIQTKNEKREILDKIVNNTQINKLSNEQWLLLEDFVSKLDNNDAKKKRKRNNNNINNNKKLKK